MHAAAAADRVHIDFNGYRPATNDYCISAESVQGDPIFGFLWRFSAGGGPSTPTGLPTFVNLITSSSTELFQTSIADREKFRVYGTLLGPIVGNKPISNELNARRSQICLTDGGGGGGVGGGGGGEGGGGGGGGNVGGGGPVNDPDVHRQLARLLGTDFAPRSYLIPEAVLCGLGEQPGIASGIAFATMGPRWCAWATPRQVNYSDERMGPTFTGTLREITFGLDYRVAPDLVVGLAFTPEDTNVSLQGLDVSLRQTGFGGGPYVGWRVRPTTIFDAWMGYAHPRPRA